MVLAGVDAGARMFVELKGELAKALLATAMKQINDATTLIAPRVVESCRCRIFHTKRAGSDAVWFGALETGNHQCSGVIWRYLQGVTRFVRGRVDPKTFHLVIRFEGASFKV